MEYSAEDTSTFEVIKEYMNDNHKADLVKYAINWSDIGERMSKANGWSQGSFVVEEAAMNGIDLSGMDLTVNIMERGFFGKQTRHEENVNIQWEVPIDSYDKLKLALLGMSMKSGLVENTGSLYQMPIGSYSGLPPNMKLNNVPHSTLVRSYFYRAASNAIVDAIDNPAVPRRMKMTMLFPELNPEMDTYRVGTMLEMVREMVFNICRTGRRVRICIQGSMGEGIFTGMPLSLAGTRAIMERMDWNEEGGESQGEMLGKQILFGSVGADWVEDKDDVFIVISPQSVTGGSIHEPLVEMVTAAAGRPVVLINPILKDRPSANNKMQVRGREERIAFAESFKDVFYFRTLYPSRTSYYPIVGALQKAGPLEPYVLYEREDIDDTKERFSPVAAYENLPNGQDISRIIK
eukprot:CAMPEP_0117744340 /NCGR_PEP_ID=MMETSP0947-20121206/6694_1 /TAXON_ID=44440 /ORGANISM="Chattonella subsalsa, Strain CCMP2191" /LENGTH=405 /DNA_ID=CAMNT_0005561257 /DNA_START=150 /DNA_END=1367 /DNA_ORIENTATION=-